MIQLPGGIRCVFRDLSAEHLRIPFTSSTFYTISAFMTQFVNDVTIVSRQKRTV